MSVLVAYLIQRFPPAVFVPAVLLLAAAAWIAAGQPSRSLLHAAGLIAILIVKFRLWDDLEDRGRDKLTHPDRVLVQHSAVVFVVLLAVVSAVTTLALAGSAASLAGLLALDAAALLAYRALRRRISDFAWRYVVLPVKYPAFVVISSTALGGASPASHAAVAALTTYLGACMFEAWHTRASRARVTP